MPARLLAISDLHVTHRRNRASLAELPHYGPDWLIAAGDIGDSLADLAQAWDVLVPRFARVIWVPGNHELWCRETLAQAEGGARGVARYEQLVELCRAHGVTTPEDEYPLFIGQGGPARIIPTFTLYDYSFRPADVRREDVDAWAWEHGIRARDEALLDPHPFDSRDAWCRDRVARTEARLAALPPEPGVLRVLVNHWPLRDDLVRIPQVPRYRPWCGTTLTESWHTRFGLDVVVSGHLHVRATDWRDGTRFEEVSLGYPRQWREHASVATYIREVLRDEAPPLGGRAGPEWKRWR